MLASRTVFPFRFGALFLLSLPVLAQDSSVVHVGGPGSLSSVGALNPRHGDGFTAASARYVFTLDKVSALLTLEVENTSPVVAGAVTPVLTRIFFNAPGAIQGMRLLSQTSSGGATPRFRMTFDPATASGPTPNKASPFGAFSAELRSPVYSGIANADADCPRGRPEGLVHGPVAFVFALRGDLSGISALDFADELSAVRGDQIPSLGAGRFQGCGFEGASVTLNNGNDYCHTAAAAFDLGGGCGVASLRTELPIQGTDCKVEIRGGLPFATGFAFASQTGGASFSYRGCLLLLDPATTYVFRTFTLDENGSYAYDEPLSPYGDSPQGCGAGFVLQALLIESAGARSLEFTNAWQIELGG